MIPLDYIGQGADARAAHDASALLLRGPRRGYMCGAKNLWTLFSSVDVAVPWFMTLYHVVVDDPLTTPLLPREVRVRRSRACPTTQFWFGKRPRAGTAAGPRPPGQPPFGGGTDGGEPAAEWPPIEDAPPPPQPEFEVEDFGDGAPPELLDAMEDLESSMKTRPAAQRMEGTSGTGRRIRRRGAAAGTGAMRQALSRSRRGLDCFHMLQLK